MKRLASLFLCAFFLCALFSGCSNTGSRQDRSEISALVYEFAAAFSDANIEHLKTITKPGSPAAEWCESSGLQSTQIESSYEVEKISDVQIKGNRATAKVTHVFKMSAPNVPQITDQQSTVTHEFKFEKVDGKWLITETE